MGLFKKPVKVKCYNTDELAKLLDWYRSNFGLTAMTWKEFNVNTVVTSIFAEEQKVLYFEVEIPYSMFKPLREKLLEQEAFDPVLEQRSFAHILGRDL